MKLIINGPVKPYYIQMLVMLFYPGEKFPEGADAENESRVAYVSVELRENGVMSKVKLCEGENSAEGEAFLEYGNLDEQRTVKFSAGAAFLNAATTLTGHTPPWGSLTGVRPARLALELFSEGIRDEDAVAFFRDIYKTTERKARLAVSCAKVSEKTVKPEVPSECSVYVGIPFCPSRCAYCSFVSYTSPKLLAMIPDYLEALVKDIDRTFALIRELGIRVSTVYIGGGTPTVLNSEQLEILLRCIDANISGVDEFTLEAGRPDTITAEKLAIAKSHGVTRVSVNTQTLNDEVLHGIGRAHTAKDFYDSYELAVKSGIKDINVDLIAGLPGDNFESFASSVDSVIALDPTNITVHTFSVKKSAEFKTEGADVYDRDGHWAAKCVDYSQDALTAGGYLPYYMYRQKNTVGNLENVGYSKPGHEGLYNIYMMDELHSIFACGASSVTKIVSKFPDGNQRIERIFEPKYPFEYLRAREDGSYLKVKEENEALIRNIYSEM